MASLACRRYAAVTRAVVAKLRPLCNLKFRGSTSETSDAWQPVPTSVSSDILFVDGGVFSSSLEDIDLKDSASSFTVPAVSISSADGTDGRAVKAALVVINLLPWSPASTTVRMTGAASFPPPQRRGFHTLAAALEASGTLPSTLLLFARREGPSTVPVMIVVDVNWPISRVAEEIVKKLGLQGVQLDTITLHMETKDEATKEWITTKEPLDSREKVKALLDDGASVVVKGAPVVTPAAATSIRYYLAGPTGKSVSRQELQHTFADPAEFDKFISGCRLHHMRVGATVTGKQGKERQLPDITIGTITSLDAAVKACNEKGTYLELRDPTIMLQDDMTVLRTRMSSLEGYKNNQARALEMEANKAVACNEQLCAEHGGELELLNDGRGYQYFMEGSTDPILEIDGVIKNTRVLLINETKSHLDADDVDTMVKKTMRKLKQIQDAPDLYSSTPDGGVELLEEGLDLVPIMSCKGYTDDAKDRCMKLGVSMLASDGSGYHLVAHKPAA